MLIPQAIQIMRVAVTVGGFLVLFGVLAIDRPIVESWTGDVAHDPWAPTLTGRQLLLSEELLRVAGVLAVFTALYLVTGPTYRAKFRDELVADVRGALAARACYLRSIRLDTPGSPTRADASGGTISAQRLGEAACGCSCRSSTATATSSSHQRCGRTTPSRRTGTS